MVSGLVYCLLGLVSLGLGVFVLIEERSFAALDPTMRTVFGALLLLYGLFRIWTGVTALRKKPATRSSSRPTR